MLPNYIWKLGLINTHKKRMNINEMKTNVSFLDYVKLFRLYVKIWPLSFKFIHIKICYSNERIVLMGKLHMEVTFRIYIDYWNASYYYKHSIKTIKSPINIACRLVY